MNSAWGVEFMGGRVVNIHPACFAKVHTTINRADSDLIKRYLKNRLSTSSDDIVNCDN